MHIVKTGNCHVGTTIFNTYVYIYDHSLRQRLEISVKTCDAYNDIPGSGKFQFLHYETKTSTL